MRAEMRTSLALLALGLAAATVFAATPESASNEALRWHVEVQPSGARVGQSVELVFTADIATGWILYSSDFNVDIGPRPARFTFESAPGLQLVGNVEAVKSLRRKDRTWGTEYAYFSGRAEFRQKAKLVAPLQSIDGHIDGQTCFEKSGLCELFHQTFSATLE
jgi:thiol:disulfide interchange protein DsbD